jgi:hypothetical protein
MSEHGREHTASSAASTTVSVEDLEAELPPSTTKEISTTEFGYKVFKWLLCLVGLLFLALALFATVTYPSLAEAKALAGPQGNVGTALGDARTQWFSQVKDVGQLFLVTPVLPLLGTVLGYMFGRNETARTEPT